MPEWLRRAN